MNVKKSDRLYKSDRLNYIVNRMRVCQDITPAKLAEELHVSERTVYRDMRNLEKGSALQKRYSRREGRYMLETELNLPPLTLTPSEALALFTAASNPALSNDNFFASDLRAGLNKVAHLLTAGARQEEPTVQAGHEDATAGQDASAMDDAAMEGAAAFDGKAAMDGKPTADGKAAAASASAARMTISADSIQRPTLETIRHAMRSHRKVYLAYWSPTTDSESNIVVAPYDLRAVNHNWYLLGNSEEYGAVRTFKISRVRKAQIAPDRFRFPRRFSADELFARAWQQFGQGDDAIHVVVRFAPSVANLVRDSRGHQFTDLIYEDDGALVCTAPVNSVKEISWWILAYGNRAEVVSPPELRAQFAQVAQEMASLYAQPPAPIMPQTSPSALPPPPDTAQSETTLQETTIQEAMMQEITVQAVVRSVEQPVLQNTRDGS